MNEAPHCPAATQHARRSSIFRRNPGSVFGEIELSVVLTKHAQRQFHAQKSHALPNSKRVHRCPAPNSGTVDWDQASGGAGYRAEVSQAAVLPNFF